MKGKLIIHIGPPKTATTALQYYLMLFKKEGFKYIGINQPREDQTIAKDLYEYCRTEGKNEKLKAYLLLKLKELVDNYKYIVVSEEMFTVENSKLSFFKKLQRLYEITKKYDPIVTFCVRNVEKVYFSYYAEIYHTLPLGYRKDFKQFQNSNFCECYKYERLYNRLLSIGFKKINFFHFNKLKLGNLTMENFLGIEDQEYSFRIKLDKKHVTKINGQSDKVITKENVVNLFINRFNRVSPLKFKGFGFRKQFSKKIKFTKVVELKKEEVSKATLDIYSKDLIFLNSLNKNL
ncbi:MAG: hypothetical protein KDC67_04250 [Ignavibacteriae bacterium]|nr:hypothetical protein [Ignavibacteriota bacterium]